MSGFGVVSRYTLRENEFKRPSMIGQLGIGRVRSQTCDYANTMVGNHKLKSARLKTEGDIACVTSLTVVNDIAPEFTDRCGELAAVVAGKTCLNTQPFEAVDRVCPN